VELWETMSSGNFAEMTTSMPLRDLSHAANLRHGTDCITSPPKEGVLKIFSPLKIRRLRPGLNPRTRVLKASTLPLDHRNSCIHIYRVSQEERTKLRESVPYVKLYRYNPKHLYPKLNGYGDNGQRRVWTSCISVYCTSTAV